MKMELLEVLACPDCGSPLQVSEPVTTGESDAVVEDGLLACEAGHGFPIRAGVPRLTREFQIEVGAPAAAGKSRGRAGAIAQSFGREWSHYDYGSSRTWHQDLEQRRRLFLREVDRTADQMSGLRVLDAGCGNGSLSFGIAQFGCQVVAVDVSDSVDRAYQHYSSRDADLHFAQADLAHPALRAGAFDIVYSSGVLHHNADTREAFEALAPLVAPGGGYYVWLYHREPGLKFALQIKLRSVIAPLPAPVKHAFVWVWSIQSMLRQYVRQALRLTGPEDRLSWRERIVDLLDIYTPRYRWMHTQHEVHGWYRDLGFVDVETTEVREWGFGVLGRRAA
jgi:2-polyprenyl-3-methyl-5-hydroxy-6-metoxy-1,4-benzoquinol methylase/uncharacterized protein YbaR (Trm112 family)